MYTGGGFTSEPESSGAKVSPAIHILLINPLITDDECNRHATLAACYQLAQSVYENRFYVSTKGGGGRVSAWGAMLMAGTLAGYKKALVCTGWAISHACRKALYLCRNSISATADSFQSGKAFTGRRALTVVSSLMSGRGRGYEP